MAIEKPEILRRLLDARATIQDGTGQLVLLEALLRKETPPPPPPPPDPPPSPPGGYSGGRLITSGFWTGLYCRIHSGEVRFEDKDQGSYGSMGTNTTGFLRMGLGNRGKVSYKVRFNQPSQLDTHGGGHLGGPANDHFVFKARDPRGIKDWTRIDLTPKPDGYRMALYNNVNYISYRDKRWETGFFPFPIELGEWIPVTIEWSMDTQLSLKVNGTTRSFPLLPGSVPCGEIMSFGNMDNILGEIHFDDVRFERI